MPAYSSWCILIVSGWHSQCWQIQNTNPSSSSLSPPFFSEHNHYKYKIQIYRVQHKARPSSSPTMQYPHVRNFPESFVQQNQLSPQQGNFKATSPIFVTTTVRYHQVKTRTTSSILYAVELGHSLNFQKSQSKKGSWRPQDRSLRTRMQMNH